MIARTRGRRAGGSERSAVLTLARAAVRHDGSSIPCSPSSSLELPRLRTAPDPRRRRTDLPGVLGGAAALAGGHVPLRPAAAAGSGGVRALPGRPPAVRGGRQPRPLRGRAAARAARAQVLGPAAGGEASRARCCSRTTRCAGCSRRATCWCRCRCIRGGCASGGSTSRRSSPTALGRAVARPVCAEALVRRRETAPQSGLDGGREAAQRARRLRGPTPGSHRRGRVVTLIDDVTTTGATALACAQALAAAGAWRSGCSRWRGA